MDMLFNARKRYHELFFFFLNNSIGMSLCNYHLSEEVRSKPHFGIRWGRDCFE